MELCYELIVTIIIMPTKVHLVRAMVFPVVMYGCESWTVKTNLQYLFLLGSEITGLTALSPFRLSFFSTRLPRSPPSQIGRAHV